MKLKSLAFGYEARSISRVKDVIGIGVLYLRGMRRFELWNIQKRSNGKAGGQTIS